MTAERDIRDSFWRTLLTFGGTRIVINFVLLVYLLLGMRHGELGADAGAFWRLWCAYVVFAAATLATSVYYRRHFLIQTFVQIGLDIAAITLAYAIGGVSKPGLAILFLFPLAGGAILLPLIWALFFVSGVVLLLLADSAYQIFVVSGESTLAQTGLYGAAFFALVVFINRFAARLIRQEDLALQRGRDLRVQQAINRLIIADMGDGIIVVNRDSAVLTINPAAERMLGRSFPNERAALRLSDIPSLAPIADAYQDWAQSMNTQTASESVYVVIKPGEDITLQGATTIWGWRRELTVRLKLRFAAVSTVGQRGERSVIFMQDVTEIENQAQQLKLASMGRLTASIAHEVRNPLSAISYAASLLKEEATDPTQKRLLNIVGDNVHRLNQLIEDILKLSRKAQSGQEPIALRPFFDNLVEELEQTHGLVPGMLALIDLERYTVKFDTLHLREVVSNLLTNAIRYASGQPGSIRVHITPDPVGRLELHVQDDGPAIVPEVRAHLFEPFYTTSSKGTGLGLYVARELCMNNGAMLDYEYRVDAGAASDGEARGRFVITFALPNEMKPHENRES